jgi:inosine/xanthosine triphosphate pyrophosphatase family protein
VQAWNGLPGALVAWFLDAVGPEGILAMAAGLTDRRATATTALGYADDGGRPCEQVCGWHRPRTARVATNLGASDRAGKGGQPC